MRAKLSRLMTLIYNISEAIKARLLAHGAGWKSSYIFKGMNLRRYKFAKWLCLKLETMLRPLMNPSYSQEGIERKWTNETF